MLLELAHWLEGRFIGAGLFQYLTLRTLDSKRDVRVFRVNSA